MSMKNYVLKGVKLKHKGIFNMEDLYKTIFIWLEDNGYGWRENLYSESDLGDAKKANINWSADKKVDDYIKFNIDLDFNLMYSEVEVEENGYKSKSHKGTFEVEITAYVLKDYDDKWEEKPISKFLREFYDKYVISNRIGDLEGDLFNEVQLLLGEIKEFLRMQAH